MTLENLQAAHGKLAFQHTELQSQYDQANADKERWKHAVVQAQIDVVETCVL